MTALATRGPIADTLDQIFEPIHFETLADVFASYQRDRERMTQIAALFDDSNAHLVGYFAKANVDSGHVHARRLFTLDPAIKALDADYWQRALALTDVLEAMPQKRRDEWHKLTTDLRTPPFEQATVISTLQDLLAQRHRFFAERVDGIFNSLSHAHVTNRPEGFSKRMIISYVYNGIGVDYSRGGTIGDLRTVIARFMGREGPRYYDTSRAIEYARQVRCGEWTTLDGGALRLRVYQNGNAHLEVHPEMAWRLNNVLASIHPNAIPEEHRRRSNRKPPKDFKLYSRPLPAPVLALLLDGRGHTPGDAVHTFTFEYSADEKPAYREACDVLELLGGVQRGKGYFVFDYPAGNVIREVAISGVLPDQRTHQFYPTPRELAARAVAAADVQPHHTVLEPSAGHGALAELLPAQQTTLVEVSALHCTILRAKGFTDVIAADFLTWSPGRRFDRVVMNPPFDRGQWERHLEHAAELTAAGGRIVAVLPVGARQRKILPGWSCTWHDAEPFPGTSIEVVTLIADHPQR